MAILSIMVVAAAWLYNVFAFRLESRRLLERSGMAIEGGGPESTQRIIIIREGGYSGDIEIAVKAKPGGKIVSVDIVSHSETPAYVNENVLRSFRASLAGKNAGEIELGRDVDAISGATVTSEAIIRGIRKAGARLAEGVPAKAGGAAGAGVPPAPAAPVSCRGRIQTLPLGIFLAFSLFGILYTGKFTRLVRYAVLVCAVAYVGFYADLTFSVVNVLNLATLRFPPPAGGAAFYLYFGAVAAGVVVFGRFYCGWACPYGALQEFIGKAARAKYPEPGGASLNTGTRLKYAFLCGAVALALMLDRTDVANYEPFITTFRFFGLTLTLPGAIAALYAVLALGASLSTNRFFCKYVCPVGATLGACSHLTVWKLRAGTACNRCGKCVPVCPVGAIEDAGSGAVRINPAECIQCNVCIKACPELVIKRSFKKNER
jgi:NAD-dependent dihydropyrimidine dehydrogenase PreA subunit